MDGTPLTTGVPLLDRIIAVLFALGALASILSHFIPVNSPVGKVVSWLALNFGKGLQKPDPTDKPRGYAPLPTLVVVSIVIFMLLSCAGIHKAFGPTIGQDELACGEAALHEATDKLVPTVVLLLTTGGLDYVGALGALEQSAGDALKCAVAVVINDFEKQQKLTEPPESSTLVRPTYSQDLAGALAYQHDLAIARGHQYLAGKKKPVF